MEPGWQADPTGRHEVRYWDGSSWTEHVADRGEAGVDPFAGRNAIEPTPAGVDPNLLWEGEKRSLIAAATNGKVVAARYRITRDQIYFDLGMLSSNAEQVPMWAVRDIDLKQSPTQKARGIGDLAISVQHSDYTGRPVVVLESIDDPRAVRDLLNGAAETARRDLQSRSATQTIQYVGSTPGSPVFQGPAEGTPKPSAVSHALIADELKKLAELRDLGVLTDDEFATQKARLLG